MNTPYDNGKIKMGIYYQPPKYVEYDSDMLYLQTALVGDIKAERRDRLHKTLYIFTLGTLVFGYFLFN